MSFVCICVGFYDTSYDVVEEGGSNYRRLNNRDVSGESRDAMEARERKKDREKQKKKENDPTEFLQMNKCV